MDTDFKILAMKFFYSVSDRFVMYHIFDDPCESVFIRGLISIS